MVPVNNTANGLCYEQRLEILKNQVSVYPVCCEQLSNGRSDQQWLDKVLEGGAKIVQLRDKKSKDGVLLEKALYFRQKTAQYGALFLVNDRLDIALLSDADGIHVGQGDMPPEQIKKLAPDMIVGLSCNTLQDIKKLNEQVQGGDDSVSYYNIGPIYETGTKEGLKAFLGPEIIVEYSKHCSLPFTVMGGIKYQHIPELVQVGATRIAVVTAITKADDMTEETKRWVQTIKQQRYERRL